MAPTIARLSPNFTLAELSFTTVRLPNIPGSDEIECLRRLARDVLERVRALPVHLLHGALVGPLRVHSGYRSPPVNAAVGGAPRSAHIQGRAADIVPVSDDLSVMDLARTVIGSQIPYDQLIYECPAGHAWLHIAVAPIGSAPRREDLLCLSTGTYEPWRWERIR